MNDDPKPVFPPDLSDQAAILYLELPRFSGQ